ncbi:MAG: tyrosine--tRNA ligase [Actinomycetota bacterium]|nr:tyrosine--tRNA ligase [Actinomycetota bacterium]
MAPDPLTMLRSGAAEIHPAGGLEEALARGRPLRVKLGLDPTAPSVTLGWAVVLRKLRQFQDAGHTAVLIVGDLTARVGDPSGKSETRPQLTKEQVDGYAERLLGGIRKVLSDDNLEIRYNSEWLESMAIDDILKLTASYTVARMLERDDFAKRYAAGKPISVMEFLYPLLQGYDSVAVGADIELGGTDQLFNLLVGRELQRDRGHEPQIILTMPLLEGLDGVQKMSQSLGNYVGIDEPPEEQFGKLMSIPDGLIPRYMRLCTSLEPPVVDSVEKGLADGSAHPNDEKRRMAREIVDLYHGAGAGADAEGRFDLVFREHRIPTDVPTAAIPDDALRDGRVWLPRLLLSVGMAASNGEARRSIEQGAVRIDGEVVTDPGAEYEPDDLRGRVLQSGRRRFIRLA